MVVFVYSIVDCVVFVWEVFVVGVVGVIFKLLVIKMVIVVVVMVVCGEVFNNFEWVIVIDVDWDFVKV